MRKKYSVQRSFIPTSIGCALLLSLSLAVTSISTAFAQEGKVAVYLALESEPQWTPIDQEYKHFQKRIASNDPRIRTQLVVAKTPEALEIQLQTLLKDGEKISHLHVFGHGGSGKCDWDPRVPETNSRVGFTQQRGFNRDTLEFGEVPNSAWYSYLSHLISQGDSLSWALLKVIGSNFFKNIPHSARDLLDKIHGKFTDDCEVYFKSCDIASGSDDLAIRKAKTVVQTLGVKSGNVFLARNALIATPKVLYDPGEIRNASLIAGTHAATGLCLSKYLKRPILSRGALGLTGVSAITSLYLKTEIAPEFVKHLNLKTHPNNDRGHIFKVKDGQIESKRSVTASEANNRFYRNSSISDSLWNVIGVARDRFSSAGSSNAK